MNITSASSSRSLRKHISELFIILCHSHRSIGFEGKEIELEIRNSPALPRLVSIGPPISSDSPLSTAYTQTHTNPKMFFLKISNLTALLQTVNPHKKWS